MELVNERLERHLGDLKKQSIDDLLAARYTKFRNIAQFYTT
jgi:acetyl-CoA carboxylase carboxyl transferase subunit alpha